MTYIIAIANEKGGVAKTTTAISLGAAMVETGFDVLLVDLDPQSNLSMALGVETSAIQYSMVNILLENLSPNQAILETGIPKLDLIAATGEFGLVESKLPAQPGYETRLSQIFKSGIWPYDYIILDCPPFLGAITTNALTASDLLIIPTQAEFFSVSALRSMMNLIRSVRSNGNPQLTYRLLLTLLDRRNRVHRTLTDQIRATFGNGVFDTAIEMDTRIRESSIAGLPIIYNSPRSRSALQYRALAQEIIIYVKETNQQPA